MPIKHDLPILVLSAIEEFTPIKVLSPTIQLPDITTCEEIKQLLPILE